MPLLVGRPWCGPLARCWLAAGCSQPKFDVSQLAFVASHAAPALDLGRSTLSTSLRKASVLRRLRQLRQLASEAHPHTHRNGCTLALQEAVHSVFHRFQRFALSTQVVAFCHGHRGAIEYSARCQALISL